MFERVFERGRGSEGGAEAGAPVQEEVRIIRETKTYNDNVIVIQPYVGWYFRGGSPCKTS